MIVFLTLCYCGLLALLVKTGIIQLNLFWLTPYCLHESFRPVIANGTANIGSQPLPGRASLRCDLNAG